MSIGAVLTKVKPYACCVSLQLGYAGMYVLSVASLKGGMNHYVLVVYRNGVAAAVISPFALWLERKGRPKVTLPIFLKITLMAILEPVLDQNLYYMGNKFTSASFSSALYNILPAVTFIIAIALRMEKIKLRSRHSQAKIIGTLLTIAGALVMILYKGPIVEFFWSKRRSHLTVDTAANDESHWLTGIFILLGSCFCWACFFIVQANTLETYPAELSLSSMICSMGLLLGTVVTLVMERSTKVWSIGWDSRLFTAVYSGVMCSGVTYYVQGIVMKERGPVFVTAFNPLCMIAVAIMGSIILGEDITLGRVIGAVIIVGGLYSLIWGKSKDQITLELPEAAIDSGKSSPSMEIPTMMHVKGDERKIDVSRVTRQ